MMDQVTRRERLIMISCIYLILVLLLECPGGRQVHSCLGNFAFKLYNSNNASLIYTKDLSSSNRPYSTSIVSQHRLVFFCVEIVNSNLVLMKQRNTMSTIRYDCRGEKARI